MDIFNLDNRNSFIWTILESGIVFDLSKSNLPKVGIPKNYSSKVIIPNQSKESIEKQFETCLVPLIFQVDTLVGYGGINFDSAVYEALRNAYEHGNQKDSSKKIILANKFSNGKIEVMVKDEGGIIDPLFALFVL